MIQVYADNTLICDSRYEEQDLSGLQATRGINVGGTATITMPPGHPARNSFVSHKTIVSIFRDGKLRFRGRALYPADNIYGERTITCEGELCLLRDSIRRPYVYNATPADIFFVIILAHNEQVEPHKRFALGQVNVTASTGTISMENDNAETTLDCLNKLLDLCGGYILFTSEPDGTRVIHWMTNIPTQSNQTIVLGENLLDFSSTGANNTDLATGLVPYGARDETTKARLTIESVNDGKDYIVAEDAVALRDTIFTTETWDDITDPAVLLAKAKEYLNARKLFITSLTLTALDLSYMDKDIDSFEVGEMVLVSSPPHGLYDFFQITQLSEDFLHPDQDTIDLGKEFQTLTSFGVSDAKQKKYDLEKLSTTLRKNYAQDLASTATSVETSVMEKASNLYASQDAVDNLQEALSEQDQLLANRVSALEEKIKLLEG